MLQPAEDDTLADRYRLDGILGSGGMAEVHRAWDTQLERAVAIKLFQQYTDETARRRFDNEIRILAGLSHPGLVSVYDTGVSGGVPFVVLQLLEGQTLRDRIACGPMAPEEVRRLGARLADALAYVHDHGVVHRDVKPSNVLLDPDGKAYLGDFGLAQLTGATRLTRTDTMVGTAAYLAPEQVRGGDVSPAIDVYALGLVLLECLTGQREYQGAEIEAAVARLHRPPAIPQDLPDDLVRLLSLMTALKPSRRPAAVECAQVLSAERPGTDVTAVGASRPLSRPTGMSKKTLLAAAATAAVGVAGIAWATFGTADPVTSPPPVSVPSSSSAPVTPAPVTPAPSSPATDATTGPLTVGEQRVTPAEQIVPPRHRQQADRRGSDPKEESDTPKANKPKPSGKGKKP